jgi:hypothetical protein
VTAAITAELVAAVALTYFVAARLNRPEPGWREGNGYL